MTFRRLLGES